MLDGDILKYKGKFFKRVKNENLIGCWPCALMMEPCYEIKDLHKTCIDAGYIYKEIEEKV